MQEIVKQLSRAGVIVFVTMAVVASLGADGTAATLTAMVVDAKGKPVEDAVISLVARGPQSSGLELAPGTAVMSQSLMKFDPLVLPVMAGAKVSFPNRDTVKHHVYSFSEAKRFELKLYSGDDLESIAFDQPGKVILGCNIHDSMIGYIYVLDTPYFGKTDDTGMIVIENLPEDAYLVQIWHPRLKGKPAKHDREIVLTATQETDLSFELALKRKRTVKHNSY